ncbi:MAG: hypothetical protein AAFY20_04855 [Cyanobacteria bacterium J06639_14]
MDTTRQQLTQRIEALPVESLRAILLSFIQSSDDSAVEALVKVLGNGKEQASGKRVVVEQRDRIGAVVESPESESELSAENIAWLREQAEVGLKDYRDGNFADITSPEERQQVLSAIRASAKAEAAKRLSERL